MKGQKEEYSSSDRRTNKVQKADNKNKKHRTMTLKHKITAQRKEMTKNGMKTKDTEKKTRA